MWENSEGNLGRIIISQIETKVHCFCTKGLGHILSLYEGFIVRFPGNCWKRERLSACPYLCWNSWLLADLEASTRLPGKQLLSLAWIACFLAVEERVCPSGSRKNHSQERGAKIRHPQSTKEDDMRGNKRLEEAGGAKIRDVKGWNQRDGITGIHWKFLKGNLAYHCAMPGMMKVI